MGKAASRQGQGKSRARFWNVKNGFDMPFFIVLIVILVIGLATLYSASHVYAFNYENGDSYFYITKQLMFTGVGLVAMFVASMVDYHQWHKFAWLIWLVSVVLLILALFMPSSTGVHRWIRLPGIQFQPSELAKFALVLLFAHLISLNHKRMKSIKKLGFLPLFIILIITCGLVVIEPHLSGTLLIGLLGFLMMFVGGVSAWLLGGVLAGGGALVVMMVLIGGYEMDRIEVWLNPLEVFTRDLAGRDQAWQTVQSLYAIGSGGLLGQGPGNSRQKHLFLPEPQNDFIFSVYCEEMGFIGAVVVIVLFGLLVWRGFKIATQAPDKFGCMLALGLTMQIGLQVAINIAVVSNLLPNTGISLPFFSYGGTSIMMLLAQMGVVLSVSRQSRMEKV